VEVVYVWRAAAAMIGRCSADVSAAVVTAAVGMGVSAAPTPAVTTPMTAAVTS
jgi:hypothetical protein